MKKQIVKTLLIFLLIYVVCFLYSFFVSELYNDEIWNYGFSYNILAGLVPYRDFNMIVTPLYSFLVVPFLKVFGNYLISLHLFNSIVLALIIYIGYRNLGWKSFILIPLVFLNCYPGYNIFSVLLILVIICLVDTHFKYKDFILGIFVGLMFLTKQTIGICLVIPLMFYSKNKFKAIVGMICPIMILIIYLIINSALYEFIDYCFLGMFDFGESNSIWLFFPLELIICLIMLYKLFKSKFSNKSLFYLIMHQIVTVPICDDYHFMIGFIPVVYYFLLNIKIEKYKIKYYVIISLTFFYCWNFIVHNFDGINIYTDKSSYLYGRNADIPEEVDEVVEYIDKSKDSYDHIYLFSKNAYYIKLEAKYDLDKFDLINDGNMGYNGEERYIEEIFDYCNVNSCMFVLYKYEFNNEINQTNKNIVEFVHYNYNKKEELEWFYVYTNNIEEY